MDTVLRTETDPEKVADELSSIAGDILEELERSLLKAAQGRESGAHEYALAWEALARRLRPLLEGSVDDPRGGNTVDSSRLLLWTYLRASAVRAPFSRWASELGPARGVGVEMVSSFRSWLSCPEIESGRESSERWPGSVWGKHSIDRFTWVVVRDLLADSPLDHIASSLGLTDTELGALFGVTRQAVSGWRRHMPEIRGPKVRTLQRIVDLLERNILPERIPFIVREPSSAYTSRSMLAMIADGDEEQLLLLLRRAFDWTATA